MVDGSTLVYRLARLPRVVMVILAILLIGTLLWVMRPGGDAKSLTAYFPRTVAIYPGSDVKILGVRIGQVDSVDPEGQRVKVTMTYDAAFDVPGDAKAVIISPAIIGDRFVQLTPAYVSGPKLADGAVLDTDRTAVPVELDTVYDSLDDLSLALGPKGANSDGALDRLLDVAAANLDGNGDAINQTLHDVGRLTGTLADNSDELFTTVGQLDRFVGMLARNDTTVREFNRDLSRVAGVLAGERDDLATALDNLGTALGSVSEFVEDNKGVLRENVEGLTQVTRTLVHQRDALKETLEVAPLALNNLYLAYNEETGTLDQRSNIGENVNALVDDPALVLCSIVKQAGSPAEACKTIQRLFDTLPSSPLQRTAPFGQQSDRQVGPVVVERVDATLGGLFGAQR
jgi:phospholipid/cholesterol/gamma-HCH transport system substrate-binding protein